MSIETEGRRVYPDEDGNVILSEKDYCKDAKGIWHVRPPGCHAGSIPHHTVMEHDDGTITVFPSILLTEGDGNPSYHGWLTEGVWIDA